MTAIQQRGRTMVRLWSAAMKRACVHTRTYHGLTPLILTK
jgi:hypothetical protein